MSGRKSIPEYFLWWMVLYDNQTRHLFWTVDGRRIQVSLCAKEFPINERDRIISAPEWSLMCSLCTTNMRLLIYHLVMGSPAGLEESP